MDLLDDSCGKKVHAFFSSAFSVIYGENCTLLFWLDKLREMGICQTVGGASTSGKNLVADVVAHAIRCAISARHDETRQVKQWSDVNHAITVTKKTATQFDGSVSLEVEEYAPDVFAYLRMLEGVSEEQFKEEWEVPPRSKMELGEGRSMAMFLHSKSMDFMCKTISAVEVDVLMHVLGEYVRHISEHKDSLLMRFMMLIKVTQQEEVGYILCFSDVFSSCPLLNERWDIKGRKPKPGKYPHFVGKSVIAGLHTDPQAESDTQECTLPSSPTSVALRTRKDKDLTRLFWIASPQREELLKELQSDFSFLRSVGLMDYSLLIGVTYNDTAASPLRPALQMGQSQDNGCEKRRLPETKRGSAEQHESRCKYHRGITSILKKETYYLGIIDMLTIFNMKKRTANFFKTFLWSEDTLSTLTADDYYERASNYVSRLFPQLTNAAN